MFENIHNKMLENMKIRKKKQLEIGAENDTIELL